MRTNVFLKTQQTILADVKARMDDSGSALATDAQYYLAINEAIRMWGSRVTLPRYYSLPTGFISGTYEYSLPSYINPPFRIQVKSHVYSYESLPVSEGDTNVTWHDIAGYDVEPNSAGGWNLRLPTTPYTGDARILYFAENGPINTLTPYTGAVVTATISSSATTGNVLWTTTEPEIGETGYFKIESEWISYAGVDRDLGGSAVTSVHSNLVRGLYDSTAASHTTTTAVSIGVAVDDQRLWVQLYDYVAAYIHGFQLHKATTEDASRHEKLMSYFQQKADNFWRMSGYVGQRRPRMLLTPQGVGTLTW